MNDNTYPCPNCGFHLEAQATFCRECGSDHRTGWSENTMYDDLDLPEPYLDQEIKPKQNNQQKRILKQFVLILILVSFLLLSIKFF